MVREQDTRGAENSEIGQRVMAVLYLQPDGAVTGMNAVHRIKNLMVNGSDYKAHQIRSAVRRLEFLGLVLRELKKSGGQRELTPGHLIENMQCVGVHLMVEKDQLPLDKYYVEELRRHIERRTAQKKVKAAAPWPEQQVKVIRRRKSHADKMLDYMVKHGSVHLSVTEDLPDAQAVKDETGLTSKQALTAMSRLLLDEKVVRVRKGKYRLPLGEFKDITDEVDAAIAKHPANIPLAALPETALEPAVDYGPLAEVLLDRLIERATRPADVVVREVEKIVEKKILVGSEADQVKISAQLHRIEVLEGELRTAHKNMDVLTARVNELGQENEVLRGRALAKQARGEKVGTAIAKLISPQEREALSRLQTQRPSSEHRDKPEPV